MSAWLLGTERSRCPTRAEIKLNEIRPFTQNSFDDPLMVVVPLLCILGLKSTFIDSRLLRPSLETVNVYLPVKNHCGIHMKVYNPFESNFHLVRIISFLIWTEKGQPLLHKGDTVLRLNISLFLYIISSPETSTLIGVL